MERNRQLMNEVIQNTNIEGEGNWVITYRMSYLKMDGEA